MTSITNEYYLMHKNIRVCLMEISNEGVIGKVRRNQAFAEHFPLGGQMNEMKFHEWWRDRAIPKTRHGAKNALQKLGYTSTGSALVNNLALSLSDCYWIMPREESLTWEEVNLFSNDFVDTFGELTINQDHMIDLRKLTRFNCATSQGELQKKWCIAQDGRRYMIKGNYGTSYQQSLNEIFACELHKKQNWQQYTPYHLVKVQVDGNQEGIGCMSYDFCDENIECISAWELLQTGKTRQNESLFHPLKKACLKQGMSEKYFNEFMDYQIMTDYLITNTDRHMNNIAVMRNPDTLEILGFAPIYDSGNSMFYNMSFDQLAHVRVDEIKTHSFVEKESRLLQYVQNRNLVNLDLATDMDFGIYENDLVENRMRIPMLRDLYLRKLENLATFQRGTDIWKKKEYR